MDIPRGPPESCTVRSKQLSFSSLFFLSSGLSLVVGGWSKKARCAQPRSAGTTRAPDSGQSSRVGRGRGQGTVDLYQQASWIVKTSATWAQVMPSPTGKESPYPASLGDPNTCLINTFGIECRSCLARRGHILCFFPAF